MSEESSNPNDLPKSYDPLAIEERWAAFWTREKLFQTASPSDTQPAAKKFTMLLPPPNVTGRLHMGHMLNQTEMDILARWHRMSGDTTLWLPGTDHAGIATQMMVERQLAAEGTSREALGRQAFTERVWCWKKQYGGAITDQMRRLGASVDWSREYFTMDPGLSRAVNEAFIRLYEQGLIYRGAYIVNWDPVIQTAVSDLEVETEDRIGKLFHIRYPLADGSGSITIATTRPETMLGDVAVAVHPTDGRYTHLIGKLLTLPLSGTDTAPDREIPILADDYAKPEFGTGAVKVTPAHDPNDFGIGQRHNLPNLTILSKTAHIDLPGSPFHGLDRFAARDRIVAALDAAGLLVKIEDHAMAVPISQRSGAVIEPRLSMQWFVAVGKTPAAGGESIAAKAIRAVDEGCIRFTPDQYRKTYDAWMRNIHDWCISRQLWWGHRIPAWHCAACSAITVARETPTACSACASPDLTQETDVLDTWFSSGLLPITVFGWPAASDHEQPATDTAADPSPLTPDPCSLIPDLSPLTPDLAQFYPTDLLVTGFDILFFWVARMIMLGTHFMLDIPLPDGTPRPLAEAVPFRAVYIHALVRDSNREKMSKTKGNVIDPIEIVAKYGTDAVRFTLASQASPGTDIAFNVARTEGYRAFANKIWNAARFLFMNIDRAHEAGFDLRFNDLTGVLQDEAFPSGSRPIADWVPANFSGDPELAEEEKQLHAAATRIERLWILARLAQTSAAVEKSLADYRFDEAAAAVYQFFWGDLCDWYLEIVKLRLIFDQADHRLETGVALITFISIFEASLRLLSPFMPFITEEIWQALWPKLHLPTPAKSIALTRFPEASTFPINHNALAGMRRIQGFIQAVRARRKEVGVPEKESVSLIAVYDAGSSVGSTIPQINNVYIQNLDVIVRLARVSNIERKDLSFLQATPELGWIQATGPFFAIVYERSVDIPAERERLLKEIAKHEKGLQAAHRQLSNEAFMAKAPAAIVEGLRKQSAETQLQFSKATAALAALPPG